MNAASRQLADVATAPQAASRTAVVVGAAGASLQVIGGVIETVDRVKATEPGFALRTTVIALAYVMLLVTVLALAGSGAVGRGAVARYGLVMAGLGWVLSAAAQLVLQADVDLAEQALFPIATIAIGIGIVGAGVGVVRSGRWRGWRRWVPLRCGLYPFVVVFPVFAAIGEPSFLVLSGWGACWLGLALALRGSGGRGTLVRGRSRRWP
jgi:hypothetical protein